MDKRPKISVIIPVYNTSKYLKQCLDSLLDQGISTEEYEIICINDGSTDNSLAILKEYAEKYPNVVIIDQENQGVSAARNKGLDIAQGDYIWFVDADDWIVKDFLGHSGVLQLLEEKRKKVPLLLIKEILSSDLDCGKYEISGVLAGDVQYEETNPFMTTMRAHFCDRELIQSNQLRFDTNLSYGEDLMFMRQFLDIIRYKKEKGEDCSILKTTGKAAYVYRIHSESAMGKMSSRRKKVADNILYRARWSMEQYKKDDKPAWYRANYQEYVNLFMQDYMLFYFPTLDKRLWKHLRELRKEGLFPAPPPKLGWNKPKGKLQKIRRLAFRYPVLYPVYYIAMRSRLKKAGLLE